MWYGRISSKRGGLTASVAAAALVFAGVPTASFAIDALGSSEERPGLSGFAFTPASVDPKLARFVAERATGSKKLMRFTPAGVAERGTRSVTVAVRVDEGSAKAISVRSAIAAAREQMALGSVVRLAPVRYNLGLSRGYQSFAQASELSKKLSDAAIPDLSSYQPSAGVKDEPSRFGARIALEQEDKTGSAPRTHDALGDQTLDVAGSYRLTRNLDVTAGVRYSQERDRIAPLADPELDSQAVYVGTQFRF
jgi:hypothetical protein